MENNENICKSPLDSFSKGLKSRKRKDIAKAVCNWIFGLASLAMLVWIVVYIVMGGSSYLSWDFITGDYHSKTITYKSDSSFSLHDYGTYTDTYAKEGSAFSSKYGVSFETGKDLKQNDVVYLVHIENGSPFLKLIDLDGNAFDNGEKTYVESLIVKKEDGSYKSVLSNASSEDFASALDSSISIYDLTLSTLGGGIRGSLLVTLSLIGLTLLFLLPLGIGAAVYLSLYAKGGKTTALIRNLIDVTSGIPSIIFGLAGALIFIPFASGITGGNGGNLISGALTLTVMLLPVVVKTMEEAIRAVPKSYMDASLALGASKTETVFKIVIPNAMSGILTSSLLSIGRIVGESAALVFAMGATIGEGVSLTSGYSTLAVHIWNILSGEKPAYGEACAIAIIIMITVLILNISIKLITYRMEKKKGRK